MLEVEVDGDVEIAVNNNIEVTASNTNVAIVEDTNDIEVTVNRQEYVITGDEIYIPKRYEDAPTWMQNLITQVVDVSISAQIQDLNGISQSLESMIEAMEVAKNTYEMSVISSNDIDERINTAVTTLNSAMNEADATVLEVAQTRVTPEEAAVITVDVIAAELAKTEAGTLGATVSNLQTAIATEEEARSTSIEVLTSSIEGAFDANATAMNYINTYVGLDEVGASTGTGLSGYLEGTDGQIGSAGSKLINDVALKAGEVENKFAYNSTIKLNGVTHNSGFGLATSINSTSIPEGDSQFWVSANEFKVVGANQTADAQGPFTVNTTTGDITFRGKVTFNSGQTGTIDEAIAQVVETVSVGDKNINITDNLIPTTSLVADANNSGYQFVGSPVKSNTAGFSSFAEPQISMIVSDEVYSLYVDEMTIPYYYRFAIKGLVDNADLSKFKIVTVDSLDVVTYSTVTATISEALVGTEWYEIDGIINPVGGDTAVASGSIRKSDGTKIGTINNFALPSGSVRLLLGWYGECIISRMKLAKITADTLTGNYVTYDYVDNGINNKVSSATTDEIAKKLGYLSYADMVSKAELGQTIINGGYLRGELIEANSIVANQINTVGLVAENISTNELNGMVINGAKINGAVIKASYLDLDGEIQVLTNYHLCMTQAKLNAVIAAGGTGELYTNSILMPDAIPIKLTDINGVESIDEYRIPSISRVTEIPGSVSNGSVLNGRIHAYNQYAVGNNTKAVKIRPMFENSNGFFAFKRNTTYEDKSIIVKLGTQSLVTIRFNTYSWDTDFVSGECYLTVTVTNNLTGTSVSGVAGRQGSPYPGNVTSYEFTVDGLPVVGSIRCELTSTYEYVTTEGYFDFEGNWVQGTRGWGGYGECNVFLNSGNYELPFDWNDNRVLNLSGSGTYSLSGIAINNMI